MAFAASKTRQRRATRTVAEGTQLIANAGIRDWYVHGLHKLIDQMIADYRRELLRGFGHKDVEEFYNEDASPTSLFKRILGRLDKKWRGVFSDFAKKQADQFVTKGDKFSEFSSKHSLKALGLDNPKDKRTEELAQTLQASIAENVSLITNVQADFANRIQGDVFRSIASGDPDGGSDKVMQNLREGGGITKRRAQLIAEDQNSKLYTALNRERMKQNGVQKFRWKHSSAGKYPRESHIRREKQDVGYGPGVFRLDSPELWEGAKADQGLPGEAIRCRCRMIPIIDFDE